jgi:hypothetical protein
MESLIVLAGARGPAGLLSSRRLSPFAGVLAWSDPNAIAAKKDNITKGLRRWDRFGP